MWRRYLIALRIEAKGEELREGDHAMLPRGQFGQRDVGCAELIPIIRLNSAHPAHNRASGRRNGAPRPFVTPQCAVRHKPPQRAMESTASTP